MSRTIRNQLKKLTERSYELRKAVKNSSNNDDGKLSALSVEVTNLTYEYEKIINKLLESK